MKKPTCETCPYWTHVDPVDEIRQHGVLVPSVDLCMYDPPTKRRHGTSRETHSTFWCRKHPELKVWLGYEQLVRTLDLFIYEKDGPFLLCSFTDDGTAYCVKTGPYPKLSLEEESKAIQFATLDEAVEATKEWEVTIPIHIKRVDGGFVL